MNAVKSNFVLSPAQVTAAIINRNTQRQTNKQTSVSILYFIFYYVQDYVFNSWLMVSPRNRGTSQVGNLHIWIRFITTK